MINIQNIDKQTDTVEPCTTTLIVAYAEIRDYR
jgi:hypothetical protein